MKQIKNYLLQDNMKCLLFSSLLMTAFSVQLSTSESSFQIGTIPVLNAPMHISYDDRPHTLSLLPFVLPRVLLHTTLAYTSKVSSMRSKIAQHALLCSASFAAGTLQVFSHELGHTVVNHALGADNLKIEVLGNYATLLTGLYAGRSTSNCNFPTVMDKSHEECISAYDAYLKGRIAVSLVGPLSGAAAGYGMFRLMQTKYPIAFKNRWFKGLFLANILWQDMLNLVPGVSPENDGQHIYDYWQLMMENKK